MTTKSTQVWFFCFSAPATISERFSDKYVSRYTRLQLKCNAHGTPYPTISWFKNSQPVSIVRPTQPSPGSRTHSL